jgi:dipeptidyl-peptidase-4
MSHALPQEAFLTQYAETLQLRLGTPTVLAIAPDGAVLFSRTPARSFGADLYELEPRSGQTRLLATADGLLAGGAEALSDGEKARRERTRTATRGILYAELSAAGDVVLVPLGERVFVLSRPGGECRELTLGEGFPYDPRLSPDGRHVAFVRDGDVWVCDAVTPGAAPRRLTTRPHPDIEYGTAELVAAEELRRHRGLWWAPDSQSLLAQRSDARLVDTLYVADARHPDRAPVPFKYPRPGRPNVIVDLGVISLAGGEPRWITWDLARWPYLAHVQWPARGPLTLVVLDREQYEQAVLAVELEASGPQVRELLSERDAAWVNLPAGAPLWLDDGAGFLWLTEARGDWTLELHDARGAHLRSLSEPSLGLRSLVALDGDHVLVVASAGPASDPAAAALAACEAHVWRIPLAGGAPVRVTQVAGVSTAVARHGQLVVTTARADGGVVTTLHASAGRAVELPSVREAPLLSPTTELITVALEERQHVVAVTRPTGARAGQRYPVLLKVYGGPHVQYVTNSRDSYLMDQWYAEAGFVVVRVDARGTPNRGRAWERATLHDLISTPLAEQIAALRALAATDPMLDLQRVGVFGWSFGGYFSAMALLLHPELFQVAVAGAPVTDWSLYDTGYTERYLKLPAHNRAGYHATSLLTHASKLERPLLLIHGTTDDNVHFAHTLALIEALYVAGKRAEVIALSGTHMVPDPRLALARERAHLELFRKHLTEPVGAGA